MTEPGIIYAERPQQCDLCGKIAEQISMLAHVHIKAGPCPPSYHQFSKEQECPSVVSIRKDVEEIIRAYGDQVARECSEELKRQCHATLLAGYRCECEACTYCSKWTTAILRHRGLT